MLKAKKYDWKDSNMALFGSDTEKKVKKSSAKSEQAWQGSGQKPGLQIWRIVKFEVKKWPVEDYGSFYDGDSYIVLNTYKQKDSDELKYDIHFWIGCYSTQDEYATAAYKTVELDTYHDDKPVQHREVQGHESSLFKSYFSKIVYLKGGADSGFRRIQPESYKPRLLHFQKKGKTVEMKEVLRKKSNLNSGDVYILDQGLTLYQWNGKECSKDEKFSAAQEIQAINSARGGKAEKFVVEQGDISENHRFYSFLDQDDDDDDDDDDDVTDDKMVLMKVSDEDGSLDMDPVKEGKVTQADLSKEDVYLIDTKKEMFVWIGGGASVDERKNAFAYAHKYLQGTQYPYLSITVIMQGQETAPFTNAVAASA